MPFRLHTFKARMQRVPIKFLARKRPPRSEDNPPDTALREPLGHGAAALYAMNQSLLTTLQQQTGELHRHLAATKANAYYYAAKTEAFDCHYVDWRAKRIDAIVQHYRANFFPGKRVLELGCGYGDLGAAFAKLGADVTCADARPEHLAIVNPRYPHLKTVQADLDRRWPFDGRWDLILHLGLLYHLRDPEPSIRWVCEAAEHIVLETEVCDSLDPRLILRLQESGYDQAFNTWGCRPSTGCVETILNEQGVTYHRLADARCNSGMRIYDWTELNTGASRHGLRRMWFINTQAPPTVGEGPTAAHG